MSAREAIDSELGSFVQSYGSKQLDASLLLLPAVGFLPPEDPRIRRHVDGDRARSRRRRPGAALRHRNVRRWPAAGRGLFLACSFWLVDAYLMLGRRDDAVALFEQLLSLRNDLGLLSEEYEPRSRRLIGNFPQAFSHLALVNSASNLSHLKARRAALGDTRHSASADMRSPEHPSAVY